MNLSGTIKIFITTLIIIFTTATSCHNDEEKPVPEVYVDFYININDPQFYALQTVGGYVYVTGGVAGIFIYRESATSFLAFDRCCTYDVDKRCKIQIDTVTNQKLVCNTCKSEFSITSGAVIKAPAKQPLKQYSTTFDGEKVHVFNNF
jgi:nitrite reductase/ring-hydroxylating ferredoxin subunit